MNEVPDNELNKFPTKGIIRNELILRTAANGNSYVVINLKMKPYTSKKTGELAYTYIGVFLWGKEAEKAVETLNVGDEIFALCEIRNSFNKKDNTSKDTYTAETFKNLGPKKLDQAIVKVKEAISKPEWDTRYMPPTQYDELPF